MILSGFVGFVSYKTRKAQYQLLNLSTHDALSGLYNRHFLESYQSSILESAKREEKKIGFMSLDLNHFKSINDTYGHSIGDKVLVETAHILREVVKTKGEVFRLGGDEFLIIIPETQSRLDIQYMKEELLRSFVEDFDISDYPIKLTLSIGNAVFPDDGEDIDELLQAADKKMYKEKNYFR
jgi:diguanylate cyclase (GGDEF)-like protein